MSELFFRNTPQLATKRLLLRRLGPEDAEAVFAYASDQEVTKYLSWATHKTIADSRAFINFTLERYCRDEAGDWGIILRATGKLIGTLGFPQVDRKNNQAAIGYVSGRRYWGAGLMPEAVRRILQFAFNELRLNRIECIHALPNEPSGRVMQKAGMTFEGIARERMFAKGRYWDVKQYAILRSDWHQARGIQ
ncbi:GNAT family N-acetyltransferase [Sporomusa termitida]|uniref:Ribosomal N-acetyltransferase YdaF n=1 Tax=Sporomusa termitida TaxID=2377 RepID=A0A517DWC1_9FIRM|nr:GNAT family protein [Sporomusa termitida]QDR81655.1 Putative ribosomal N-acetyltransferase YdaF [Sporomusa termitida]